MNNFWQGFTNGFAQGMFNNMFRCFMPCCNSWNVGFGLGMSVFTIPMAGWSSGCSSVSVFNSIPMPMMQMPMSTPMGMPQVQSIQTFGMNSNPLGNIVLGWNNFSNTYFQPAQSADSESTPVSEVTYDAKSLYAKWSKKGISKNAELSEQFCQKVIDIGNRTNCNPDDIMAIMYHETRFNPHKPNDLGHVGLIQFGEGSRKELGFPGKNDAERKAAIMKMNSMEQLDYVEKYIMTARKHRSLDISFRLSLAELAALAIFPAHVKQDVVIDKNGSDDEKRAYNANKDQDLNHDGKITKDELVKHIHMAK